VSSIPDPVVEARALGKAFDGVPAVRGIDLRVARGLCFGFLGPNGAGKTTTLRMILGQSPPTGGELRVLGLPVPAAARAVRARIGVVPQKDNLDPDLSVVENLRVYASYFGIGRAQIEPKIGALLRFAQLEERARARITTLSGGMQRRLSIARALVNDPEVLVLDEPTTGLDPQARHLIWNRLRELRLSGKTLLLTSHYMEEAERLCDDLVIMEAGGIIARGHPKAIIREQVEPEVVEIHGGAEPLRTLLDGAAAGRVETRGTVTYCYLADAQPLLRRLEGADGLGYVHRPANLEDVFLRLTGHELRE
jgi:lipooligosaccharide transport system ATP-binding protein